MKKHEPRCPGWPGGSGVLFCLFGSAAYSARQIKPLPTTGAVPVEGGGLAGGRGPDRLVKHQGIFPVEIGRLALAALRTLIR